MVNRVIQAKLVKIKKDRRLAPRNLNSDYIHINIQRSPEFKGNPDPLKTVFYRGTTDAREAERRSREAFFEAMFPELHGHKMPAARRAALALRRDLIATLKGWIGDIPPERHLVVEKSDTHKVMMYFDVKHTYVFFLYFNYLTDTLKKSRIYSNRTNAIREFRVFGLKKMLWKQTLKLPSPDQVSSP